MIRHLRFTVNHSRDNRFTHLSPICRGGFIVCGDGGVSDNYSRVLKRDITRQFYRRPRTRPLLLIITSSWSGAAQVYDYDGAVMSVCDCPFTAIHSNTRRAGHRHSLGSRSNSHYAANIASNIAISPRVVAINRQNTRQR